MNNLKWILGVFISITICGFLFVIIGSTPPGDFPINKVVSIQKNSSLSTVASALSEQHVIRSMFLYKAFVVLLGGQHNVMIGDYLFDTRQSSLRVAYRTIHGIQGLTKVKITIPEGSSSGDIADILQKNFPQFKSKEFISLASAQEGYLFPETYYFYESVTPERVVEEMRGTFDQKIATLDKDIATSSISLKDLITMSSIVEREASNTKDRKIVAGILWKRIKEKMPLQVDATFYYLLKKTSAQLTVDDLKLKSPYNTYTNLGLPPGPISNPGLAAIEDTIKYTETKYWYYLAGKDGVTHYASTLEEHVENKRKYL
jgi:UPF0755 protein